MAADEIAELRVRLLRQFDELEYELNRWRNRLHGHFEIVESWEADPAMDVDTEPTPDDAPPEYQAVLGKVARGELDWFDVLSGETQDDDARMVHVWLEPRFALARLAIRLMERGLPPDEAVATAESELRKQ